QLLEVAVIDLSMPGVSGPGRIAGVRRGYADMAVVGLAGAAVAAEMEVLLDLGVRGYIPKAYSPEIMLSAVRLVLSGGVYVPPMLLAGAPGAINNGHRNLGSLDALRELLTERQIEVLRLLSQGKPNKSIARDLNISEGTVKIHLAAIFRALDVRNRVEAVVASRKLADL